MTKQEFGERTRIIREAILGLTQTELAEALGSEQTLVSRMERGLATFDYVLNLLDYYKTKGLIPHMIFYTPFQKELLLQNTSANSEQVIENLIKIKEHVAEDVDRAILLVNAL